jgi:kynurenine formamidase
MTTASRSVAASFLFAGVVLSQAAPPRAQAPAPHTVTDAEYARWKKDLSNWGRWGKDDEIGALNLITPAKRKQAAALVKDGVSVSLSADADTVQAVDNPTPYEVVMQGIGSDRIAVSYHGIAHTHLDSLAHINESGVFYNGYTPDQAAVVANRHAKNSIHNVKNGIFTRGVLIDIPRLKGVPYLEPGTPIYVEDLEAWEKQAGVKVSAGDALFVRTGVWARRKALGPWLRGDHPQYVSPSGLRGAVHDFALVHLGVHLLDNCDLEALGAAAAARRRWDFLLTVAPLAIPGGTGSPANPVATF